MQDVLLLAMLAGTFAFGWFLMGKLDGFLETNGHRQESPLSSGENILRLGFCEPTAADGITNILENYSKLYPNVSVRIYCGSEEALLKGLSAGKFDVIFLPETAEIPAHIHYNAKVIALHHTPVMMKYGGLPVEPIIQEGIPQKALWADEAAPAFAGCFVECLEARFPAPAPGK